VLTVKNILSEKLKEIEFINMNMTDVKQETKNINAQEQQIHQENLKQVEYETFLLKELKFNQSEINRLEFQINKKRS